VTREGNRRAQEDLWRVFRPADGCWRGIARIPDGNLRLRDEMSAFDARRKFDIDLSSVWGDAPSALVKDCVCGDIMAGVSRPSDCRLFGAQCTPDHPVGACMVSTEGSCRIWHQYGGRPELEAKS
jgi:hydrogenase expression/formation protein HypD